MRTTSSFTCDVEVMNQFKKLAAIKLINTSRLIQSLIEKWIKENNDNEMK